MKETDELGRIQSYTYDEQLNRTGVVQADGTTRKIEFDEYCRPLSLTDEEASQWRREYDNEGNLTATVNPLQARREFTYNRFGDITAFRNALGNETELEWTISGLINQSVVRAAEN